MRITSKLVLGLNGPMATLCGHLSNSLAFVFC